MINIGKLFVVSAPSGCGKTTLCKKLIEAFKSTLDYSISYTTRQPRKNEVNGRDYYFVDASVFNDMLAKDEFLEWAKVYNDYYGTAKKQIEHILSTNKDILLDIDPQGAMQVRKKMKNAILIMILPPSLSELEKRLRMRNTESEDKLRLRLGNAKKEILNYKSYDYIVVNDDFDKAFKELTSIYIAGHCKVVDINDINKIIMLED
jgi:guanylate kinase